MKLTDDDNNRVQNERSALLPITSTTSTTTEGEGKTYDLDQAKQESSHDSITLSVRKFSSRVSSFIALHTGSIGMTGSMAIAVNSLTGPAMLGLPALFARSGIIPTSLTVLLVACLCSLCSLHLANAISKVDGNRDFRKEVEYSEAFHIFWGVRWFNATQVIFFFCITCLNISSTVDTAQVIDTFLGSWFPWGGTAALRVTRSEWSVVQWDSSSCSAQQRLDGSCTPFAGETTNGCLFTMGTLLVTVIFLPLALLPLKENASYQVLAFLILLLNSVQFAVTFSMSGLDWSVASWWGREWGDLFGVVLFNFPLVIAIPAWLYERDPHVDVPTVVHGSCALSAVLYIVIGILGNLAMPNVSDNMLQSMMTGVFGLPLQLGASVFAFAIVGFGIPLFSVLTRLNLVGSGLCSETVANLLAVYLPFTLSWFLYDSKAITKILSWGGMIFTSLIAFFFPILLAIHVTRRYATNLGSGAVAVYFGHWTDPASELVALRVLLVCSILAIVAALVGNLV